MARVIATISGTALAPGVSRNNRLYTREAIARAVGRAQQRIADGSRPLTVMTHHAADDDSTRIIGRITGMSVAEDGSARFTAALADTPHGQAIASLASTDGGAPFLSGMSIRGAWIGKVRHVKGPSGEPVETGDDLEFFGIDPTKSPGVDAARIDTFTRSESAAAETAGRVLITESTREALVTFTGKAARRAAQEAADRALVDRMVAERLQAARLFGEASIGRTLSEASRDDLALMAAMGMSGRLAPAARPVVEMTVDAAALSLEDLAVAAAVGSAGASPFWTGQTSGQSPFMRGLRAGDGTAGG